MNSSEQHGRTRSTRELFVRFIPYFRPYLPVLILDLFCAGLTTLCELILPVIVRYITNLAQYQLSELTVSVIARMGMLYLILRVIDTGGSYFMANVGHVMGAKWRRICGGNCLPIYRNYPSGIMPMLKSAS